MDCKKIAQITLPIVSVDGVALLNWAQAVFAETCSCGECGPCIISPALSEFVDRYTDAVVELAKFVSPVDREREAA